MSVNKVLLTGNLVRDPELRYAASGSPVLAFSIAVNDRTKNSKTGEWEDRANFIDCSMFGNRAEGVSKYLSKGAKVTLLGRLRQSTWETKEGYKRSKIEVVVEDLEFMSKSAQGAPQPIEAPQPKQVTQPQPVAQPTQAQASEPVEQVPISVYDMYTEDLPF